MGILNVTPDSFSDGGKYSDPARAVERALVMQEAGADIIDIGGESSRPGSQRVSAREELSRVMPVLEALRGAVRIDVSIDTYKSEVAERALKAGASIVNDISALGDPDMARVIAGHNAGVVLMHMKGDPGTMQDGPVYDDVVEEVYSFLRTAVGKAKDAGIDPGRITVDPGIGFGKTVEHNLVILKSLSRFRDLGKPVMTGVSKKSFLGKLTDKGTGRRPFSTAAAVAVSVMNGADIVRVHDVEDMRDVVRIVDAVRGA